MKKERLSICIPICTPLMFAMAGNVLSAEFVYAEHLVPGLVKSVYAPSSDSYESNKAPWRVYRDPHSRKQPRRAFYALFIVTSLLIAMLTLLKCPSVVSKQAKARPPVRRLAAGEEDEGEKDLLQSIMEMCGIVPEGKAPVEREEAAPPALPPERAAGAFEAAPETEEPRKKEQKIKWLQTQDREPSPQFSKKTRVFQPFPPKDPSVTTPVEDPVAGPFYAVPQKVPFLSVSESPALVLQAPALPRPPPANEGMQLGPDPLWGHPPSEFGGAAILQEPHLYASVQQIAGPAEVSTAGEGVAAQAPVAGNWPAGVELPADFAPLLVGPGDSGAPATQPVTTFSVVPEGAESLTGCQQHVQLAPEYAQATLLAEQGGGEGAEAEAPREGMVCLSATANAGRSIPARPPALELHPFYRLPLGHTGGVLPVFDPAAALAASPETHLAFLMKLVRPLFAKDILNQEELEVLHNCAYLLVGHSSKWNVSDFDDLPPCRTLGPLAYRLLAADALWCICNILGPSVMKTDEWWGRFMERLATPSSLLTYRAEFSPLDVRDLIEKITKALDMFKEQQRPPPELLVKLKRRLVRKPYIHKFKLPSWDPWRADDDEFQQKGENSS